MMHKRRPVDPDGPDTANPTTPSDLFGAMNIIRSLGTPSVINWAYYDRQANPPPLVDIWVHQAYRQVRL